MSSTSGSAPSRSGAPELVKASLTCMETLESIAVLWNPAWYRVQRRNLLHSSRQPGASAGGDMYLAGAEERFRTELFVDTTDRAPDSGERDGRALVRRVLSWMEPSAATGRPSRVVFLWGSLRFVGTIESLVEDWIRFDPDGTPVRAWVGITLRR